MFLFFFCFSFSLSQYTLDVEASSVLTSLFLDNAIPIQGWINDPTDNDLLHLVPFLEGLQYVSDVRALLALRGGEDGQHMAYN